MTYFSYLLVVIIINHRFSVNAYSPIAIGQESVILPHEIGIAPVWQTWPTPSSHPGYEITNIGKSRVQASIYRKDSWPLQNDDIYCQVQMNCSSNSSTYVWFELAEPIHIEPAESVVIKPPSNISFYFTRLVVSIHPTNSSESDAIVYVLYDNNGAGLAGSARRKREAAKTKIGRAEYVKNVFKFGGSKLPPEITSSGMKALVELFWPENKPSVWDEILDKVSNLTGQETYCTINALGGRLMGFKWKLEQLAREIQDNLSGSSFHYMNLAQDFIGIEEESVIRGHNNTKKMNENFLLLYSNIILMKAAFYNLGMRCHREIGLKKETVANLKTYFTNMIRSSSGANQHISQMFRNQSNSAHLYNKEMHMRNKLKEHGYVPTWNNMLDNPGQMLIIDELLYSYFLGTYDKEVFPPSDSNDSLSAAGLSKGKYNEIRKLIIYQSYNACKNCCSDAVVGVKLTLQNGVEFQFGEMTHVSKMIELNGTYRIREIIFNNFISYGIANIRVNFFRLDKNEWKISSMEEYLFGCPLKADVTSYFSKENYYIASMYVFFSGADFNSYPLWRIGVSYLPLKSHLDSAKNKNNWKEWTC